MVRLFGSDDKSVGSVLRLELGFSDVMTTIIQVLANVGKRLLGLFCSCVCVCVCEREREKVSANIPCESACVICLWLLTVTRMTLIWPKIVT